MTWPWSKQTRHTQEKTTKWNKNNQHSGRCRVDFPYWNGGLFIAMLHQVELLDDENSSYSLTERDSRILDQDVPCTKNAPVFGCIWLFLVYILFKFPGVNISSIPGCSQTTSRLQWAKDLCPKNLAIRLGSKVPRWNHEIHQLVLFGILLSCFVK